MSTIPELRAELRVLAARHGILRLRDIADELERRPARRSGRKVSTPMTPQLAAQIRSHARANPTLTQVEIGRHFNVNPGRVSECVNGKRR